ncbi:serine/threonine protein kinase, CMGC, CDC2/CDK sub [Phlyctochytrium planicorne]|nr:serine/threonine protein kinase, CMGC, CDC2/CDK sub [Phlyctochytrium planicorne]
MNSQIEPGEVEPSKEEQMSSDSIEPGQVPDETEQPSTATKRPISSDADEESARQKPKLESEGNYTRRFKPDFKQVVPKTDSFAKEEDKEAGALSDDDMQIDDYNSPPPDDGPIPSPPRAPPHPTIYEDDNNSTSGMATGAHAYDGQQGTDDDGSTQDHVTPGAFSESGTSPSLTDGRSPSLQQKKDGAPLRQRIELRQFVGCSSVDDYQMERKIGEGTFGEVNTMLHVKSKKRYALKKILMHNEKEGIPITALREIKILKSLSHKNIVQLTEMSVKKGNKQTRQRGEIFMVFPYMDHDLTGLLENPNVRFNPSQIKSYTKQLLEGTRHLHTNNILHRDMKTANILVDNKGNLKIADFGLARAYRPQTTTNYTNCVVTRWYRPPELLLGVTKYGPAIDMWGVGCVFGEILRRKPILMGNDDIDQLNKIFQLAGTPTEQTWPQYPELLQKSGIAAFDKTYPKSIRNKFHHFIQDTRFEGAVELLEGLLVCDPAQRLSADHAVAHRYFFCPPKAAEPNTADFSDNWESSHELSSRVKRSEAMDIANAIPGLKQLMPELPPHYDVNAKGDRGHHGGQRGPGGNNPGGAAGGGGGGGRYQGDWRNNGGRPNQGGNNGHYPRHDYGGGGGGNGGGGGGGGGGGHYRRDNRDNRDRDGYGGGGGGAGGAGGGGGGRDYRDRNDGRDRDRTDSRSKSHPLPPKPT